MKRILKKSFLAIALIFTLAVAATGCGGSKPQQSANPNELSGNIQIAGSTSVQPLSEELAKEFMAKNPGVRINVAGGGSGAGIKAAQDGTANIGASSRELKSEEKTVKEVVIALDGIAVIVHKDNKIADLKKDDIKKIFLGEITDWSKLGGDNGVIRVITREEGSGTRGAFEELVLGKDAAGKELKIFDNANVQNSTGAVRTAVAADKNAIGYVSLGSLNADVKDVKVDGTQASVENIKNKTYKISRPFIYMTQKEPEGVTKAFIDWVQSDEGQTVVQKGFISVK
ncbi:MAG: phosphate ABC transporter substrate-binding protein [Desulfotomaculaceae bacterium]|nr:phosphate ABC transporter substrate-binding protein [Desulfotomaculaceae bacterium]